MTKNNSIIKGTNLIILLFLILSCSSSNENRIVGRWVSTTSEGTYYEFLNDKTLMLTVKYADKSAGVDTFSGRWWNTEDGNFRAEVSMNSVKTNWVIRLSDDTMFIKGEWVGATEDQFKRAI